jgi:hypothetical protein
MLPTLHYPEDGSSRFFQNVGHTAQIHIMPSPLNRENVKYYTTKYRKYSPFFTSAFCIGDTRQQMTTLQLTQRSKKSRRTSQLSAYLSVFPSITKATSLCFRNWSPKSELCLAITSRVFCKETSRKEIQHWGNKNGNEANKPKIREEYYMHLITTLLSVWQTYRSDIIHFSLMFKTVVC